MKRITKERTSTSEDGFLSLEAMGALLFALLMIAGVSITVSQLFSGGKVSETQQAISNIRMNTQQMFTGSLDYTGLDNVVAIKSGLIPKKFLKGGAPTNGWGGAITIAAGTDTGTFTIALADIPQDACTKMAVHDITSWDAVAVNGGAVDKTGNPAAAAALCTETNTIVYTAR